ncbi:hypothetical protein H0R92_03625 [Treponema sp. OMZ 840]|uniref:hypothetical protein n=1 Tax=Treponema sp. OMZ 840 TaxID=244313 RepID=UPI003D91900D
MSKPLYRCITKATNKEAGEGVRYSQNWVLARRAIFKVYEKEIRCGDWLFDTDKIQNAVLYHIRQMLIPGSVLEFTYEDTVYQFGFNPWAHPEKYFSFPIETKKAKMRYSPLSLAVRVFVLILIAYEIIKRFKS